MANIWDLRFPDRKARKVMGDYCIVTVLYDSAAGNYISTECVFVGRGNADQFFDTMVDESKKKEGEIARGNESARNGFPRNILLYSGMVNVTGMIVEDDVLRAYACEEDHEEFEAVYGDVLEK